MPGRKSTKKRSKSKKKRGGAAKKSGKKSGKKAGAKKAGAKKADVKKLNDVSQSGHVYPTNEENDARCKQYDGRSADCRSNRCFYDYDNEVCKGKRRKDEI